MITFGPELNPENVVKFLQICKKQANWAGVLTVNSLAKKVQTFTVDSLLPKKFTLRARGNPWQTPRTKFGFNIKFANTDAPSATVGSQADWLRLQEEGGSKTANGHNLAIPTSFWKPTPELMQAFKKPRAILGLFEELDKARTSVAAGEARSHRKLAVRKSRLTKGLEKLSFAAIFLQTNRKGIKTIFGREKSENGKYPIRPLFTFHSSAPIKPVLGFVDSGKEVVHEEFSGEFSMNFAAAMADAKEGRSE